jgi:hypothetical protein
MRTPFPVTIQGFSPVTGLDAPLFCVVGIKVKIRPPVLFQIQMHPSSTSRVYGIGF